MGWVWGLCDISSSDEEGDNVSAKVSYSIILSRRRRGIDTMALLQPISKKAKTTKSVQEKAKPNAKATKANTKATPLRVFTFSLK